MTDINSTINGGGGASTQSNSIDSKTSVLSGYSLSTSAQTVVGAINEILPKATGVGKVDPNSDGTGEIFNAYENANYFNANQASGSYSHAEGRETKATGISSHAEGNSAIASGRYSHAEGSYTNASDSSSHAEGENTNASGNCSHAEGYYTRAEGDYSHAEGQGTKASGACAHAEGRSTLTSNAAEHAEGQWNLSSSGDDYSTKTIHSVGIGSSNSDRKNAHEIKFNGDQYIYGVGNFDGTNSADAQTLQEVINSKQETITPGTGLEFEGNTLNVTLDTTVFYVAQSLPLTPAKGNENKICLVPTNNVSTLANFPESGPIQNEYTEYIWTGSTWEELGKYYSEVDLTPYLKIADAVGKIDSTSDGTGEIFNSYSGAIANEASGSASHAEGSNTTASASGAHAEGYNTTASGNYSHAEGYATTASGNDSHSEGNRSTASGAYSHAEGDHTEAFGSSEHSEGKYNKSYKSISASVRVIHSVGIGSAESDRKNAHEIKINGDHYVYGVGSFDGSNSDTAQSLQEVINNKADSTLLPIYTTVPTLTADYNIPANATTVEKVYDITVGETLFNITYDPSIKWVNGVAPITTASHRYLISVINNLGAWGEF